MTHTCHRIGGEVFVLVSQVTVLYDSIGPIELYSWSIDTREWREIPRMTDDMVPVMWPELESCWHPAFVLSDRLLSLTVSDRLCIMCASDEFSPYGGHLWVYDPQSQAWAEVDACPPDFSTLPAHATVGDKTHFVDRTTMEYHTLALHNGNDGVLEGTWIEEEPISGVVGDFSACMAVGQHMVFIGERDGYSEMCSLDTVSSTLQEWPHIEDGIDVECGVVYTVDPLTHLYQSAHMAEQGHAYVLRFTLREYVKHTLAIRDIPQGTCVLREAPFLLLKEDYGDFGDIRRKLYSKRKKAKLAAF
ncbi:hypothetical protein KIPB_002959 [Kipferlia bialata]|uniref:Kelch-type beta propeller n=1 Tax=Kipferlia bialata TaxID=797122 RepID=A0A9K3CRQ6_9EUKA|nr:hypothetical protein KIPB_002959 [Kipferlia bialata]|eukprot:g2959.t1